MTTGKNNAHETFHGQVDRSNGSVEKVISVQDAVNDFLQSVRVKYLSPRTREEYTFELQKFAQWCMHCSVVQDASTKIWSVVLGETMLHQVTDQVVYLYLEYLKMIHLPKRKTCATISNCTLASYVRVIKTFLNWCMLNEDYEQHIKPVTIQRIKKPQVIKVALQIFSREQIGALFEACDKEESEYLQVRDRAMLAMLLDTGIRVTELIELRLGNVYLDPQDAHVKVLGKGGKRGEVGLGKLAQEYLQKYISMFREPAIYREVTHLSGRQRKRMIEQKRHEIHLFVNRRGNPMTKNGLWRIIQRLGEWANIDSIQCTPHALRRTFAVNFMRQSSDIYRLSKLLRHSSVDVTEVYLTSYLQSEARRGAKSVLDNL
jgi:integrase/recombinase XerD